MLRKVRIEEAGDTELLPMELFDRFEFEDINARTIAGFVGRIERSRLERASRIDL